MNFSRLKKRIKEVAVWVKWQLKGRPLPPPQIVKQKLIKKCARRYHCQILVETGTCLGDTIDRLKNDFQQIFSIELSPELFRQAQKRFEQDPHINLFQGDSGEVLPSILPKLNKPTIFWLDGHYSGGVTAKAGVNTPIIKELGAILNNPAINQVILIDDARLFIGQNDYPSLRELADFIASRGKYEFKIKNDVIIIQR
ncbi:MAG: hypothetical protein WC385_00090 [Candidatus Paceibacterota bacterium]|jgi:hypothetical protein